MDIFKEDAASETPLDYLALTNKALDEFYGFDLPQAKARSDFLERAWTPHDKVKYAKGVGCGIGLWRGAAIIGDYLRMRLE